MAILGNKNSIIRRYKDLAMQAKWLVRKRNFQKRLETLEEMIGLVKKYPELFEEANDRIKSLEFRKLMTLYDKEREYGSLRQLDFLKEAIECSTPTVCIGKPCPLDPQRCRQGAILSKRQRKMCIEKISAVTSKLKIEAAISARALRYDQALFKRREAVRIHQAVVKNALKFDPYTYLKRFANQLYLEYWQYVTECYVSLFNGDFDASREWLSKACDIGKLLNQRKCFPNYFRDIREIQAHEIYITGVEKVKLSKWLEAGQLFRKWLNLNWDRAKKYDFRFDNIEIYERVCNILQDLSEGKEIRRETWEEMFSLAEERYVARPTFALLERMRELCYKLKGAPSTLIKETISKLTNEKKFWRYFIPDVVLLGEDRIAGLARGVNFLKFTYIFDELNKNLNWKQLLFQNMKNLFLIMVDYERLRCRYPPLEESHIPQPKYPPTPSEKMSLDELIQVIIFYLNRRSKRHARIFRRALRHLDSFKRAITGNNFDESVKAQIRLFKSIRFWPHVIYVKQQKELPKPIFLNEDNPNFLANETICTRLWNRKPDEIVFEGIQDLREGTYYYLRPRWNTRYYRRYRIRHEQFLPSELPKLINVFYENIFGKGKVNSKRFHKWILQFGDHERLMACKLFSMLEYYTNEEVREMWRRLFVEKLPPQTKTERVAFVGLGHEAKSGPYHCYYFFRQAMAGLAELRPKYFSFEFKEAFRHISEYDEENKPDVVVFIDDFIGSGKQAINWFIHREEAYFKKYPWLKTTKVYYCALVGFNEGIKNIKDELKNKIEDVIVLRELDEKDKAFSDRNPNWKSEQERLEAKKWAEEIGRQILTGMEKYDPERDKLGWEDSQALIAFQYNIPNNTLPIFWARGERNGKQWKPLFDRYD